MRKIMFQVSSGLSKQGAINKEVPEGRRWEASVMPIHWVFPKVTLRRFCSYYN
jgi:hypothetical protein